MNSHIAPVDLSKASRLINHGPTVLVSSHHNGIDNVMAAAWVCALDYNPPKLTAVIAKDTSTRQLVDGSLRFVIQVPTTAQVKLTRDVGSKSLADDPDKLKHCGVELFRVDGHKEPFVAGCSAWLLCQVIPEPHNQDNYDLFIGEIIAAWADTRVFKNGHWLFEEADPVWKSIHHVAGGHFYGIGEPVINKASE
jgi:flavin reductase (DIM6/NTAB) family NADH-FMN oxidoreductase RutF